MATGCASVEDGLANTEADDGRPDNADPDVPAVACVGLVDANEGIGKAQKQQDPAIVLMRRTPPLPGQQQSAVTPER